MIAFENGLLSPSDIIAAIEDGGFDASISSSLISIERTRSPEIFNAVHYPPIRTRSRTTTPTNSRPSPRPRPSSRSSVSSPISRKLTKSGTPIPGQKSTVTVTLRVQGMTCASCVASIERHLSGQTGIIDAKVALLAERADIEYVSEEYPDPQMVADLIVCHLYLYCRMILGLKLVVSSRQ
jgi:Cu+-exporting ATPase